MAKDSAETPLMRQYYEIKRKHPDSILLFRVGDFYETFCEDAVKTSKILGITLTKRSNGAAAKMDLAGFPYHSLDTYMPKLVQAGERVAICEQLEDPKSTTKLVKRGVTEMITPGVSFNNDVILNKQNNFVASIYFGKKNYGISFLDVTTGEFLVAEGHKDYIEKLLVNFSPKEVLYQRGYKERFIELFGKSFYIYHLDEWVYSFNGCDEKLKNQFGVTTLKGYGIDGMDSGIIAAGSILFYLDMTEHKSNTHINGISKIDEDKYVWLDKYTLRNLEVLSSTSPGGKTLINVMDKTITAMGARLLRRWVSLPLKDVKQINKRLEITTFLINNPELRAQIVLLLNEIGDVERLVSKVATTKINPRELIQLAASIDAMSKLKRLCESSNASIISSWTSKIDDCKELCESITRTIVQDAPVSVLKGNVVARGVDAELDDLRRALHSSKDYLIAIQQREIECTGIPSLKVSSNGVFGYYIEVRNTHKDKVPASWIRIQTLVSSERYTTEELKEYEQKIYGGETKILAIESEIYRLLVEHVAKYISVLQENASIAAKLDTLQSYAELGASLDYCCPTINSTKELNIVAGRHPVIETLMPLGDRYIPNDLYLDDQTQQIIIITGPNMSGKSAILRQTALIVLMAQAGCYVPAQHADIGVVDKIFTRVGASDNITQGESTFMVEMLESANILNNISDRSLVLLDEIGRGTSTYDGISIAWAMVEYIHQKPMSRAKTLFATHYHELNEMENIYPRIKNFNVQVKEVDNRVVFIRKLAKGGTAHSFGIHVAAMAGMPKFVIERSNEILKMLEERSNSGKEFDLAEVNSCSEIDKYKKDSNIESGVQLSFFQLDDPLIAQLKKEVEDLDINKLTPLDALNKLNDLKRIMGVK